MKELFDNPIILLLVVIGAFLAFWWWRRAQLSAEEVAVKKFYNSTPVPFVLFARTIEENSSLLELANEVSESLEDAENGWNPPIIVIPYKGVYQKKSLANMTWAQYQIFCADETIRIHRHWQQAISNVDAKAEMSGIGGMAQPRDYDWDDVTNRFSKLKPAAAA
jgi:hypothetical protein